MQSTLYFWAALPLSSDSHPLVSVSSEKYLGVTIDAKLLFNHHIDVICKKANLFFSAETLDDLYLMYVKPIIDYSVSVWAPHTYWAINQLNSIQRRDALFFMSDYRHASSVSNMLSYLQWFSIESQHKEARLIMFFKVIHGIGNLLTCIQHSSRPLRGNHLRCIQPAVNRDSYKFSFYPASIKLWDNLPPHIADCHNLDEFKKI